MSDAFQDLAKMHPDAKTGELLMSLHTLVKASSHRDRYHDLLFETLVAAVLKLEALQEEMRARTQACQDAIGIVLLNENSEPIFPPSTQATPLPEGHKTIIDRLNALEAQLAAHQKSHGAPA